MLAPNKDFGRDLKREVKEKGKKSSKRRRRCWRRGKGKQEPESPMDHRESALHVGGCRGRIQRRERENKIPHLANISLPISLLHSCKKKKKERERERKVMTSEDQLY